jgi:endonuclease YncB( thermonuclease family)
MRQVLALFIAVSSLQTGADKTPTIRNLVGTSFDITVTAVADGDTVDALPRGEQRALRVRLHGIDAPEQGEPFSQQARVFTRTLLFDRKARAEGRDVDRYGRLVARLLIDGKDASIELVRAGLACHYTAYSSDPLLAKAQVEARANARGFWARGAPKPRCVVREQPRDSEVRDSGRPNGSEKGPFNGNIVSQIYHASWCPNFKCRNCTRTFASEADARAAGFRPSADCLGRAKSTTTD